MTLHDTKQVMGSIWRSVLHYIPALLLVQALWKLVIFGSNVTSLYSSECGFLKKCTNLTCLWCCSLEQKEAECITFNKVAYK